MSQVSQKYICLNSSTSDKIHGVIREIGSKLAKRIVRRRKNHPFRTWDDLKYVTGIGKGIVKKLRDRHYLFLHYPPTQAKEEMEELAKNFGDQTQAEEKPEYNVGDVVCLANSHGDWGGWLELRARIVGIRPEYPGFYDLEFEEGVRGIYRDLDFDIPEPSDNHSPYYMQNITNRIGNIYFSKVINIKRPGEETKQLRKDLDFEGTSVFEDFPFVGRITSRALICEHPKLKELKINYRGGEVTLSNFGESIKSPRISSTATVVGKNHDHILTAAHQLSHPKAANQVIKRLQKKLDGLAKRKLFMPKRVAERDFLQRAIIVLSEDKSEIKIRNIFFPQFHCNQPHPAFQSVSATVVIVGKYQLEGIPFTYKELLDGPTNDAKYRRGHDYALLKLSKPVPFESDAFALATISGRETEIEQALTDLACFGYPGNTFEYKTTKTLAPMIYDEHHCLGTRTAFSSQSDHMRSDKSTGLKLSFNNQESYIQVRGLDASEGSSGSQLFMKHKGRFYGIGILGGPCISQPLESNPDFAYEDTAFCPYTKKLFSEFQKVGLHVVTKSFHAKDLINQREETSVGMKRSLDDLKSYNRVRKRKRE